MKKITLLIVAFVVGIVAQAQTTLIQNTDNVITGANSVGCPSGDNFWARNFVLADFGIGSTDVFEIVSGEIGVQTSDIVDHVLTANIYTSDAAFPANFGTAILLGTQAVTIPANTTEAIVTYTFDTPVIVPAGTEAVLVEYVTLLADPMFIGGTADETEEGFIKSVTCGLTLYQHPSEITPTPFPDAHFYITVTGDVILGVDDILADHSSIYPNPATDILNVKLPSNVEVLSADLFDVLGKNTGVSFNNGEMNISGLANGFYILNVKTSAGTLTEKVVKE